MIIIDPVLILNTALVGKWSLNVLLSYKPLPLRKSVGGYLILIRMRIVMRSVQDSSLYMQSTSYPLISTSNWWSKIA